MIDTIKQQIYLGSAYRYLGPNFGVSGIPVISVDSCATVHFEILYENMLELNHNAQFGDLGHAVDRKQDPDNRDWAVDQKYGTHPYDIVVVNGLNPRADTMRIYGAKIGRKFISDINFNNVGDYLLIKGPSQSDDIKVLHNITQAWRNWCLDRGRMFLNK